LHLNLTAQTLASYTERLEDFFYHHIKLWNDNFYMVLITLNKILLGEHSGAMLVLLALFKGARAQKIRFKSTYL